MKILVLHSGGLDSMAMGHLLMTSPEYKDATIHFLHYNLKHVSSRYMVEEIAFNNFIKHAQRNYSKPFTYSKLTLDYTAFGYTGTIPKDVYSTYLNAARITLLDHSFTHVATGRNRQDRGTDKDYVQRAEDVFNLLAADRAKPARLMFPIENKTKLMLYTSLPLELKDKWWSCRLTMATEKTTRSCGTCPTCKELRRSKIPHPVF